MKNYGRKGKLNIGIRLAAFSMAVAVALPSVADYLPKDISIGLVGQVNAETSATHPVTYKYYTQTLHNVVPSSWLFVGTYLMSAKSLKPVMYQQALSSRKQYDQEIAYYTSELDEGQWKNVKDASSISSILPESTIVPETELYPYLITCVVGDDGKPRDPLTGEVIDVFEPDSPYEMENIPELDAIEEFYKSGEVSVSDDGVRNYLYRLLYTFFEHDNQDTFDRNSVDVGGAVNQYTAVADTPKLLEFLWDVADKGATNEFPEEYQDILKVMNNWSNIRDKVTDKADIDEDNINELYNTLTDEGLLDEADAALFVCRGVDSLRRSEIYYNLLKNTNLTGSYMTDGGAALDELMAKRAEVQADQANKSAESDILYALVKDQLDKIDAKTAERDQMVAELNAAKTAWATEKLAKENEKKAIQDEITELNKEYLPLKAEYERLDSEVDEIYNETMDFNQEQKDLEQAIKDKRAEKDTKTAETEAAIKELQDTYNDLNAQYQEALANSSKITENNTKITELDTKMTGLNASKDVENTKLESKIKEMNQYSTSRFSAFVDSSITYDPEKRRELEKEVDTIKKGIEALELAIQTVTIQKKELTDEINDISAGLALQPQVEEAKEALDTKPDELNKQLAEDLAAIENEAVAMEEQLAAMSAPYQEKLQRLKAKNDEFTEVEGPFLDLYAVVSKKEYDIQVIDFEITKAETELQYMQEDIDDVNAEIEKMMPPVETLQVPVDAKNKEIELLDEEITALDALIKQAKEKPKNPYPELIAGLEKDVETKKAEKAAAEASLNELTAKRTALENSLKVAADDLKTKRNNRDTNESTYQTDRAGTIKKYDDIISGLNANIVRLQADIEAHKVNYDNDDTVKQNKQTKATTEATLKQAQLVYELERKLDVDKKSITFLQTEYKRLSDTYDDNQKNLMKAESAAAKKLYRQYMEDIKKKQTDNKASEKRLKDEIKNLEAGIEEESKKLTSYTGKIPTGSDTSGIPSDSVDKPLSFYILTLQKTIDDAEGRINARIAELDSEYAAYLAEKQAEIDQLRQTVTQNEGLKQAKLEELDKKHTREIAALNQAIDNALGVVEDYQEKVNVAKQNEATKQKECDTIKADTEQSELRLANTRKNAATYNAGVNFGVAPTLYFLRSASMTGTTEMGRSFTDQERYKGYDFSPMDDLDAAIDYSIAECATAYEEYTKSSMRRGDTAYTYTGYILSREVLMHVKDKDAAIPYLQMIVDLLNIEGSTISENERELSLLYGWLIPFSMSDFDSKRTVETKDDYQFYIRGVADRAEVKDAITFVEGRLEYAYSKRDTFTSGGQGTIIEDHILWLENLLAELRSKLDDDDDSDKEEREKRIREELEMAEYNGDLGRARKLDDLLKDLQEGGDAEDDGGPGGDDGSGDLDPTKGLGDRPTPSQCIGDVKNEDKNTDGYDPTEDDNRLANSKANISGSGGEGGDTKPSLSPDDADDLLADSGDDDLANLVAMAMYAGDNGAYKDKLKSGLEDLLGEGNMFIYRQYMEDKANEYVSFGVVDKCSRYTGFRYVVDEKESGKHTMAQIGGGSASYTFEMGKNTIVTNKNDQSFMDKNLVEQGDEKIRGASSDLYPYITKEVAEKYLNVSCIYIEGTDYAILVTESTKKKAEALYQKLKEAEKSQGEAE